MGTCGGTSRRLSHCGVDGSTFWVLVWTCWGSFFAAVAWCRLPLLLVQSLLAFSIGVTARISAFMDARLAATGWVALGVGAAGLILLGLSAEPGPAHVLPPGWRWILLGMAVLVGADRLLCKRHNRVWAAPALAFGAGVGFSVVGIPARTMEIPDSAWRWAIVLNGLTAAVVFAMALQKGGPTAVTATPGRDRVAQ